MSGHVISKEEYDAFRAFLESESGIVLGDSKQYLVSSRLNRLLESHKLASFTELIQCLKNNRKPGLKEQVVDAMTTNETNWFRDLYPYDMLREKILPDMAKSFRDKPLRIWSAACSSGQEPYSLSIVVQEFMMANPGTFPKGIQIVATDISPTMLNFAKAGCYDESAMARGVSEERKRRFFIQAGNLWEVRPEIRNRVSFKPLNLQSSYTTLGKFDIIFCRNVLIYFSTELKTDILTRLGQALMPQGYLFLGSSEAPNRYTPMFSMEKAGMGVVYRLK